MVEKHQVLEPLQVHDQKNTSIHDSCNNRDFRHVEVEGSTTTYEALEQPPANTTTLRTISEASRSMHVESLRGTSRRLYRLAD